MADERVLSETEKFFYDKIPITRAMGVRVTKYDGDQLRLAAPIALNHNHLGTAFGGSLSALATLAAYGLIWLEIGDKTAHVVIRNSEISFRRPVRREIVAICRRPSEDQLWVFKKAFAQHHKAKISLDVTIEEEGFLAVEFRGIFVALR